MSNTRLVAAAFALALALAFASCGGSDDNNPVPVADVSVSPGTMELTVGASESATATLTPDGATDQNVTWTSDDDSIASVSGVGLGAMVTAVAPGNTVITVLTRDGGKTATCAVTVAAQSWTVTKLLLPKAISVKSAGGLAKLTADIWPYDAPDRNVTWESSNTSIATVSADPAGSQVAAVTGLSAGTATITATPQGNPSISTQCVVTVAQTLSQDIYLGGEFGLVKNGVPQSAYSAAVVHSVFVDPDGALHAAGYDDTGYPAAIYIKDGVAAFLPCREGAVNSSATAMHVTDDGHVYIAGYEYSAAPDFDRYAKLWMDGVDVPLEGQDGFQTYATGVFAHGGNVYVVGHQTIRGNPDARTAVLWINQAKTVFGGLVPDEGFALCVAALGGDVYVGGVFGLMRLAPANPSAYQLFDEYINHNVVFRIQSVLGVRMVGGDIHASGWVGNDPVYWLNHAPAPYPWDTSLNYADVRDTALVYDGSLYAVGREVFLWDGYEIPTTLLWKDGVGQALPGLEDLEGSAFCIFIK
jgi:hypothetical protein